MGDVCLYNRMVTILAWTAAGQEFKSRFGQLSVLGIKQEAQLMLTTGSTRLAVSRGQQTWYHSTCYI